MEDVEMCYLNFFEKTQVGLDRKVVVPMTNKSREAFLLLIVLILTLALLILEIKN